MLGRGFSTIADLWANLRFADLLDIAVIGVFAYFALQWLRSRASRSVAVGVASVALLYTLARALGMHLTSMLFQVGLTALMVGFLLVFQDDVRRLFERLAAWRVLSGRAAPAAPSRSLDLLAQGAWALADRRVGALLVLPGREPIERHLRGGIALGGRLSLPLLYSIVNPQAPAHDGALVVEGDRIVRFGVHLPLSRNLDAVGRSGTRHAAAMGLAERCDALVVVVSEERGTVSVARGGRLDEVGSLAELRHRLDDFVASQAPESSPRRAGFLTRNPGLKAASLAVAALLWIGLVYRGETTQRSYVVPIEYRNLPATWSLDDGRPTQARVTLQGLARLFRMTDSGSLVLSVDLSRVREGEQELYFDERALNVPPGLAVTEIEPRVARISAHEMVELDLPVRVQTDGRPARGFEVAATRVEPSTVRVRIARARVSRVSEIRTEPVRLGSARADVSERRGLVVPDEVQLPEGVPRSVRVTIQIRPRG